MVEPKKKILIVDDHPMLRRGLASLIETAPDLEVCGEAATCQDALAAVQTQQPDLVIVDIVLEGPSGLELVKGLRVTHPQTPTLVLSMHDEFVCAARALKAGASGYLNKQQLDDTVLVAIRTVLGGATYMSRELAAKFIGGGSLGENSPLDVLSDRELEVFQLLGQGLSTRQVAESLGLSIKTVESHREHIKRKLALKSGAELVRLATRWIETGRSL